MTITEILLIAVLLALIVLIVLLVAGQAAGKAERSAARDALDGLRQELGRGERTLRDDQSAARSELQLTLGQLRSMLLEQLDSMTREQQGRIDGFGLRLDGLTALTDQRLEALRLSLVEEARKSREEGTLGLNRFGDTLALKLGQLAERNDLRLGEVRALLEAKLKDIQSDNARQLEAMRATVDEKLHATLETRLGESFRLVSERLELVHSGLGEMKSLAAGVGDLKRVLSNVKSRGGWGEVQLGALLEQILIPEQYATNVETIPGSNQRVEFAIRLPGLSAQQPLWLPIDAKFPREDYERLLDAQERADVEAAAAAGQALERRIKDDARRIRDKYVAPPYTTDFAILFLPTEGLYAEVLRRPGLVDILQQEQRVTIAGPSTLTAILNSLQMGFRTLAIEQRSSEVWQLLGAVKTEFGKFGNVLVKTRKQLKTVVSSIGKAEVRTRAIERKLRVVQALESDTATAPTAALPGSADPEDKQPL